MAELLPFLRGERQGKVVGITLDDGYQNNVVHALPALMRHGFSATCYVISRAIGQTNEWDHVNGVPTKTLMSDNELRTWLSAGMHIGAHSQHHRDLNTLDDSTAREEIFGCRDDLEERFGQPVDHFCYPYGRYTARDVALVRQAGYQTATTTQRGRYHAGDDPLEIRRVLIAQSTHTGYFLAKLLTTYEDKRG
ncbi:MAG: hypothetical protein RIQ60_2137 [Pseudomonadota bacterium]